VQLTEILPSLALELEQLFKENKVSPNLQHKFRNWRSWTVAGVETTSARRLYTAKTRKGGMVLAIVA